ncbi:ATP-binding protein [Streptomyces sp. NPDC046994]|uniref:ATP-binding protein n=1 Tax=Streptomyces sp. NPDC046994 TaxID=3155735 RepID=UPI003453AA3F
MTVQHHRGLTAQPADAVIDPACRMLRLRTFRAQFPDPATTTAREQMTYSGFLTELLMAENDDRARRRSEHRIKAADFPRQKALRDFDTNSSIDAATIHILASCEWIQEGRAALPDRRLRHRQVPSADRTGDRGRDGRLRSSTSWPPSSSTNSSKPPATSS